MDEELLNLLSEIIKIGSMRAQSAFEKAINGPSWLELDQGKILLSYIKGAEKFKLFDEKIQCFANVGISVSYLDIADWLVVRSLQVGAARAVTDFQIYLSGDVFEAQCVYLISDLHVENEHEFCNGVRLLKATTLENSRFREGVNITWGLGLPLPAISSVLCKPCTVKKYHYSNTDLNHRLPLETISFECIDDVMMALILIRPGYGIHTVGQGVIVEDHVPVIQSVSGWSLHQYKLAGPNPSIIGVQIKSADNIVDKLSKLDSATKAKIRISIERLNGFYSCNPMVDKAIDLRICLESIFLTDGNKEQLRFSLALRAAQFLSSDPDEKLRINKLFKTAYDVTSTAVHSGKMPSKNVDTLQETANYARSAILKIIDIGKVNWDKIELGI